MTRPRFKIAAVVLMAVMLFTAREALSSHDEIINYSFINMGDKEYIYLYASQSDKTALDKNIIDYLFNETNTFHAEERIFIVNPSGQIFGPADQPDTRALSTLKLSSKLVCDLALLLCRERTWSPFRQKSMLLFSCFLIFHNVYIKYAIRFSRIRKRRI